MSDIDIQVIDENNISDLYDDVLEQYISLFCEKYCIDNLAMESQSRWNSCLEYIYNNYFKHNIQLLKHNPNINNKYNIDACIALFDRYRYYCNLYTKEITYHGYELLSGITKQCVMAWGRDPTCEGFALYKKISEWNENSNSDLLENKNRFMGAAMRLNKHHDWDSNHNKVEHEKPIQLQITMAREQFESFQIEQKE